MRALVFPAAAVLAALLSGGPAAASDPARVAVDFVADLRPAIADGRFDPRRDAVGVRGAVAPLHWGASRLLGATDTPGVYRLRVCVDRAAAGGQPVAHKFKIEQPGRPDAGWEPGCNRAVVLPPLTAEAAKAAEAAGDAPCTEGPAAQPAVPALTVARVFGTDPDAPSPQRTGRIERWPAPLSRHVGAREVQVWLPPGYGDDPSRRHPVLYLHDGQNVFDAVAAGAEWQADEHAQRLVEEGAIEPLLIVAVASTDDRIADYTPWPGGDARGGAAAAYARFLVDELKPAVDARYRTRPQRGDTAVGGSSLGGLVSAWLLLHERATFGAALVVSPSVGWADGAIVEAVRRAPPPAAGQPSRLWLDIGGREGDGMVDGARRLREALAARGWPVTYLEDPDAGHTETAWAARLPRMLTFLHGRADAPASTHPAASAGR